MSQSYVKYLEGGSWVTPHPYSLVILMVYHLSKTPRSKPEIPDTSRRDRVRTQVG